MERLEGLGALLMLRWQDNLSHSAKPCSQRNVLRWWRLPREEEAIEVDDVDPVRQWLLVQEGTQGICGDDRDPICEQAAQRRTREGHQALSPYRQDREPYQEKPLDARSQRRRTRVEPRSAGSGLHERQ